MRGVMNDNKTKSKYWYKTTTYYCPVCGKEEPDRERMYTPKPEDSSERYVYKQWYDSCEDYPEYDF